jgi:hypothetical protein
MLATRGLGFDSGHDGEKERRGVTIIAKTLKWLLVGLIVGLAPVWLKAIFIAADEQKITRQLLLGDGELFLVAAGLAAAGIGDLLFEVKAPGAPAPTVGMQLMRGVAGFTALLIAFVAAGIYGSHYSDAAVTTTYINYSMFAIATAAVCGLGCVFIAELA